jgi:hypothetical protein
MGFFSNEECFPPFERMLLNLGNILSITQISLILIGQKGSPAMFKKLSVLFVIFCFVWLFAGVSLAADLPQSQQQDRAYGRNLMTPEERVEHRTKMRSFKTNEERERYRIEHHNKMKERGITLPDQPRNGGGMGLGDKRRGGGGGRGR